MACSKGLIVICVILVIMSVFVSPGAYAQDIEISSSLNPVGSGARATGMGGAFIAVADDATAASWNPAGLIQLEKPEISVVYSYFHRKQEYSSSLIPELDSENSMDSDSLNYASFAFPFVFLNRNMIVSLNYQRLFDLNKEINFTLTREGAMPGDTKIESIEFTQGGFLYTLSPAYAIQIIPSLYLGATLNFWDNLFGKNGWDSKYMSDNNGTVYGFPVETLSVQEESISFKGTNAHFGFLWQITDALTLGGVYKTAFDADLDKESSFTMAQDWPTLGDHIEPPKVESSEDLELRMPASYGAGLAYRHSDSLTVAFDIYRTEWSRFVLRDESGEEKNPLDKQPINKGRLKDTTQVRMGMEYLIIREKDVIPLRFGIFYDPEPAKGHLDEFYGFSLGSGYARGRIAVDFAYQFRTGNNLTGDIPNIPNSNVDMNQHTVMASAIVYLK